MIRAALLIGNPDVEGVPTDLNNFKRFLLSNNGGAWKNEEIITLLNPSTLTLRVTIINLKVNIKPDFVIVFFTGHGGYTRTTQIQINTNDEIVDERSLWDIAPRQITIMDCCRAVEDENESIIKGLKVFSEGGKFDSKPLIREVYDWRIMDSLQQHVRLYSCSVGEYSLDAGINEGGLYFSQLLNATRTVKYDEFLTINDAHNQARMYTSLLAKNINPDHSQTPTSISIKCLKNKQLILAINPNIINL